MKKASLYSIFFVRKKFTQDDIYELAEYTINRLIPDAPNEKKKEAIERYLSAKRKSELNAFVFQLDEFAIIIGGKGKIVSVLDYLGIKQNMTTNFFLDLGTSVDDFLLWVCWATNNHDTFPDLKLRRIREDKTEDRSLKARSQREFGGKQILDSFDFKYRIGGGYLLKGLKFEVEETNLGMHMEIGVYVDDMTEPTMTVSAFKILQSGTLHKQVESSSNFDQNVLMMNIAIDLLYRLIREYKNDTNWDTKKREFIDSQMQEAGKLFKGNQSDRQSA